MPTVKGRTLWGCEWCPRTFQTKTLAELHEIGMHMQERVSAARMKGRNAIRRCKRCGNRGHTARDCYMSPGA